MHLKTSPEVQRGSAADFMWTGGESGADFSRIWKTEPKIVENSVKVPEICQCTMDPNKYIVVHTKNVTWTPNKASIEEMKNEKWRQMK